MYHKLMSKKNVSVHEKNSPMCYKEQIELWTYPERGIKTEPNAANRIKISQLVLIWRTFKIGMQLSAILRKAEKEGPTFLVKTQFCELSQTFE